MGDIDFTTFEQCNTAAEKAGAANTVTFYNSLFHVIPPAAGSYLQRMEGKGYRERCAIVAEYYANASRGSAPSAAAIWIHTPTFFAAASRAMTDVIFNRVNNLYDQFRHGEPGTEASLEAYRRSVEEFRTNLGAVIAHPQFSSIGGNTTAKIVANQFQLATLIRMLERIKVMREQRAVRLVEGGNVRRSAPTYVEEFIRYANDPEGGYFGTVPLTRRQATNNERKIRYPGEADANFQGKGYLLLSTAFAYHTLKVDGNYLDQLAVADGTLLATAVAEARLLVAQQIDATDLLFNCYFWLRKLGHLTRAQFCLINRFMYNIGIYPMGRKKKAELVKTSTSALLRSIATFCIDTGTIHSPPFMLTYKRFDDWIPCVGLFQVSNYAGTIGRQSSSWRCNINMDLNRAGTITFLTDLFTLEQAANGDESDFFGSCHLLEQLFINKVSPYSYAGNVTGNALGVVFDALGRRA